MMRRDRFPGSPVLFSNNNPCRDRYYKIIERHPYTCTCSYCTDMPYMDPPGKRMPNWKLKRPASYPKGWSVFTIPGWNYRYYIRWTRNERTEQ